MDKNESNRLTELFLRAAEGDQRAAKEFWEDKIWDKQVKADCEFICWRYPLPSGNLQHDAEDLAQKSRLRMVEKCEQFRGRASVRTWFMCIAKRLHFREFTKRQREREVLQQSCCEVAADLSDKVPGVWAAVMEAWDALTIADKELYELYLQCDDLLEVEQVLTGSSWFSLPEKEQVKVHNRVKRDLKKIQKQLMEAAELKWLTVLGQQKKDNHAS